MARAGRRKSWLSRMLVLGLVALDLGVQLLSLPATDVAGLPPSPLSAGRPAECRPTEGTLATLVGCLFRCFSDSPGAQTNDDPVGDVGLAAFPRVEVMVRHKAVPPSSPLVLPPSPSDRSRTADGHGFQANPSSPVIGRSIRLCRLIC